MSVCCSYLNVVFPDIGNVKYPHGKTDQQQQKSKRQRLRYISQNDRLPLLSLFACFHWKRRFFHSLLEISRGEEGGNRGRVSTFWDSEKRGVMKNGPVRGGGSSNICPWSYWGSPTEEKEVLYLVKKKKTGRNKRVEWSAIRIRVRLLMLSSKMYVYGITKNWLEIFFEFS